MSALIVTEETRIKFRRLNHVTIAVPAGEQDRVREFYGSVLGLSELPRNEALQSHYALIWFQLLDFQLHLHLITPWVDPPATRHVALEVRDLAKVREYLESKGVTIREAVAMPDRVRFYLLDPFGNSFEFIEFQ